MGLAIDPGIKPPDVKIPGFQTKSEGRQLNTTHQLSHVMQNASHKKKYYNEKRMRICLCVIIYYKYILVAMKCNTTFCKIYGLDFLAHFQLLQNITPSQYQISSLWATKG